MYCPGSRMRAVVLFVLAAVSWPSIPVMAQNQTVIQNTVFQTANQSMWQPGPQTGLTGSSFLGTTWGQQQYSFDYGLAGNDAFGVVQLQPGKVGLQLDSNLTTGNVSVQYPVKLTYNLPQKVHPGDPIQVSTSWAKNPGPSLTTTGLQASASLSLVLNLKASAGAGYDPPIGSPVFSASQPGDPSGFSSPVPQSLIDAHAQDVTLVDTGGDVRIPIVSVGPSGANFRVAGGPFSITATAPQLNVSGNTYAGDSITATGTSAPPFISGNFDLVSAAIYGANALGIPLPQLSGDVGLGSVANINWTGLSVNVQAGPALYQSFTFTPTSFPITLTTSDGQTATGKLGDTFTFTAPNNPGLLGITATASINDNFTNNTGIVANVNLNTQALGGSMEVGGYSLFSFGPLINVNNSLYTSNPWLFPGSPEQFALGGFNDAQQAMQVLVVPEPAAFALLAIGGAVLWLRHRRGSRVR